MMMMMNEEVIVFLTHAVWSLLFVHRPGPLIINCCFSVYAAPCLWNELNTELLFTSYHTQFVIFTIFTVTTFIFFHSFNLLF